MKTITGTINDIITGTDHWASYLLPPKDLVTNTAVIEFQHATRSPHTPNPHIWFAYWTEWPEKQEARPQKHIKPRDLSNANEFTELSFLEGLSTDGGWSAVILAPSSNLENQAKVVSTFVIIYLIEWIGLNGCIVYLSEDSLRSQDQRSEEVNPSGGHARCFTGGTVLWFVRASCVGFKKCTFGLNGVGIGLFDGKMRISQRITMGMAWKHVQQLELVGLHISSRSLLLGTHVVKQMAINHYFWLVDSHYHAFVLDAVRISFVATILAVSLSLYLAIALLFTRQNAWGFTVGFSTWNCPRMGWRTLALPLQSHSRCPPKNGTTRLFESNTEW